MVSAPVAVGVAYASINPVAGTTAVVDVTAPRGEASITVPQPHAKWGIVVSRIRSPEAHSVAETVRAAATAAEVMSADIERAVVIAVPPADDEANTLGQAGVRGSVPVSPVMLAGDGLAADAVLRGERQRDVAAPRVRGAWPRPVSSLACLIGSVTALAVVMSGADTIGAQPDMIAFALACLGLFTSIMGMASFGASQLVARRAGWRRAGHVVMIGAGLGAAAVTAAVVIVAAHFGVSAWSLLLAGGLAVAPSTIACGVIGAGVAAHPDSPPSRNLWPPVGALAAVTIAAAFVHTSSLESVAVSGWDLLPTRIGVGVWLFAIAGLVITAPWPRVAVGLAAGFAAGMVAGPGTVGVFAVVVIAVVSGWWLVRTSLVHFDWHGLPDPKPPTWVHSLGSRRTVH